MKKFLFVIIIFSLVLVGCGQEKKQTKKVKKDQRPQWVSQALSKSFEDREYEGIFECKYQGKTVYYTLSLCCDQYNPVYDAQKNYICAPTGGITGQGDGNCQDLDIENQCQELK